MILVRLFIIFGITFISIFVHEGMHLIEAVDPIEVCYTYKNETGSVAHVKAKDFKTDGELFAYYYQTLFILSCLYYMRKNNVEINGIKFI